MKQHSHLGVYGIILSDNKNKLLVIKKARGPYTGLYDLPGGSLENGELLEEALKREINEETRCDVLKFDQVSAASVRYCYKDKNTNEKCELRHVGILYKVSIYGEPTEEGDGFDSHGCVWVSLKDITANNSSPFVQHVLEVI